ncbi:MAG TPA: TatD family hydrolase, partial [Propionibacteriaceae bacterium]
MELPDLPEPLPAPVVDSHCHLDSTQAKSGLEPEDAVRLAAEVGVTRIVQIGCDPDGCRWAVQAAERWPAVVAGVAIHPNDAARLGTDLVSGLELVEALAQHRRVRAVGETGLDYF